MTGTSASNHEAGLTAPADVWRLAIEPLPIERPSAMKTTSAETFRAASTLPTMRPGPTPRTWTQHIRAMTASATSAWRETVNGIHGIGTTSNGASLAATGTKRRVGRGSIEIAAYTSARSKRNCVAAISVRQTARQPSREPNHTPAS